MMMFTHACSARRGDAVSGTELAGSSMRHSGREATPEQARANGSDGQVLAIDQTTGIRRWRSGHLIAAGDRIRTWVIPSVGEAHGFMEQMEFWRTSASHR
jgi:hypothetical protein